MDAKPVIFHKLETLYLALHNRIIKFPKTSRHSLGIRMQNILIEIIELLYLAISKHGPSRLMILNKTDIKLKVLVTYTRLAYKTKCLNDAGFAEISKIIIEIGKMLGGWIKSEKSRE